MKNYLMVALILCAIPAVAVGQTVSCDDCSHVASVYMGEGGVIATADDADMVTWVATCSGVTRTGELPANDDGVVSALWTGDLACMAEKGGSFELGPVMDGGWFWVTDAMNSAVGGLVSKDVLENDATDITSAGDGVSMTMGKGAVHLKEASTGRVGILPNILPEPPAPAAVVCGPRVTPNTTPAAYTSQAAKSCMLGGGGTKVRVLGPAAHGRTGVITGGMVTRPAVGELALTADLWVDESGSYNTGDLTATPNLANRGWVGKGTNNWLGNVGWTASLHGATPGASLAGAAVAIVDTGNNGQANITITPSATYCPAKGTQTTAVVNILAWASAGADGAATTGTGSDDTIFPALATQRALGGAYSAAQIRIVCPPPASSANQGQELVPENPFPISE